MMKFLIINGPNLNMLGTREPGIYGNETLEGIRKSLELEAGRLDVEVEFMQSNHEGEIIDAIHSASDRASAIIINPGAYTHYSIAIRDAIKCVNIPTVEIHISNLHTREEFRSNSVIAPACIGQISGFGPNSYLLGLRAAYLYCSAN